MVGRVQGRIEVEVFVSCPKVKLEAEPVYVRIADLEQVMPEGGVHVLLPVIIDIGIVIVEHVREVDVAQRASFDGIVQTAISPFADTACQGDLGVITCLMVVGDVKQGGDNILTVETDTHVDGAVGLVLHLEDQVPVLVADQFVVDVPVGVGSDQDRDGVLELLHGQVAVLFQATDLQQPGLVLGVGALEMDMSDMKRIGRESGRLPSDRYFVVRDADPGFQGDDLIPLPSGCSPRWMSVSSAGREKLAEL